MAAAISSSCSNQNTRQEKVYKSPALSQASPTIAAKELCPIPPVNYNKIPGYQPGKVDPSLSQRPIDIISPTLEGNPTFYLGILQQPVRFCGTAKDNIVKIKLFATGAYIYEKKDPVPAKPELLLGETSVKHNVWFFSYHFRDGEGVRRIIARGYDSSNQVIATTSEISITLAAPNPS